MRCERIYLSYFIYQENSGYLIRTLQGPLESFEKEYFDLIRSAFLKYRYVIIICESPLYILLMHYTVCKSGSVIWMALW